MSDFLWRDEQTIVMTGDSITDCGRLSDPRQLGSGYVRQVVQLTRARYPERRLNIINTGISGHCTDDLLARWQSDVLDFHPQWVTIMIGINDLHRHLAGAKHLPPEVYLANYRQLCSQVVGHGARLVLIDPFYMCLGDQATAAENEVLNRLTDYLVAVDTVAAEFGALHVPTQEAWEAVLPIYPARLWCDEPVHPNADGHLVLANAVLQAVGF